MTTAERIEKLEDNLFILAMKDHWTTADYDLDAKWRKELRELRKAQ